ncbi:MAG: hypothetical protein RLZZ305_1002 [Actinomycetota bacterium]|jgi:hypothetical protein
MNNRRTQKVLLAVALALVTVSCGGGGNTSTDGSAPPSTDGGLIPELTNDCEKAVGPIITQTILDASLDSVYAKWGQDSVLVPVFDAIYAEMKPAFTAGAIGITVSYVAQYAINVCKDNDVYNAVLGLSEGDEGYRTGCLDGKMPDVNEALKACAEDGAPSGSEPAPTTTD